MSFPELLVLGTVALLVLGPDKLPGMLRTLGRWLAKLRHLTTEVRYQSGIDDVLRAEGFDGGLTELRSIMRGGGGEPSPRQNAAYRNPPVAERFIPDKSREYPVEGPDAYGALPEDLLPGAAPALPAASADEPNALPSASTGAPLLASPSAAVPSPPAVPPPGQKPREIDG